MGMYSMWSVLYDLKLDASDWLMRMQNDIHLQEGVSSTNLIDGINQ